MKHIQLTPVAIATMLLAATSAPAQQPTLSTTTSLGEVVVSGTQGQLSSRQVFSSVNVLPQERIESQVVGNNWQLYEQVPGLMLTRFGQGTTSGKLSFRGFNGEGEINAVKLLIDGIPSNSNDGNMPFIDLVPVLDIESIEVVKGTNDPRYGLHNIAGNSNIVTKSGDNYRVVRLSAGAFGTVDAQAALGIEKDGFAQNYAISSTRTNGFRDHANSDGLAFSGKWFLSNEEGSHRIGLVVRSYESKAQEAGYLTTAQAAATPMMSPAHNARDEDTRRVTQIAVQGETRVHKGLTVSGHVYRNDIDDRRFVRFSSVVSQQERFVGERHTGASVQATLKLGMTSLGDVTLLGGLDAEQQDNLSDRFNTVNQVRTAQTRNQQFNFNTIGGFVQAMVSPTPDLKIIPAFRVDSISGSYTNRLNGVTYAVNDYGQIPQPKLSAIYRLSPAASLYGNWGRSFQVGVGTGSYKVNQATDLAPSINEGWEFGVKFKPAEWMDGRVAAWKQTASNEARRKLNDPANSSENIGETKRQGIDLEINAKPSKGLALWSAVSSQSSEIVKADAASPTTLGKEIDHVPRLLYGFGLDYKVNDALRISAWGNGQSNYFLERTNTTGQFGEFVLFNLSAAYQINKAATLELQVRNLFDRYYEYVWHDGTQALHSPGAPRAASAVLTVKF